MKQTKSYYDSFESLPKIIADGWHNVIAMDNDEFCEERKVFVSNNKIVKYFKDDWLEREVKFSGPINNGKGLIKLNIEDEDSFLDIYFLEYISDRNSRATVPKKPGRISFWTNWKRASDLKLYFSGVHVGTFTNYFTQGSPSCGQDGTITLTYKPGTYQFRAESTGNSGSTEWEGSVTIYEDNCSLQGLTKK